MKQTSSAAEAAAVTEAEVQAHGLICGIEGFEAKKRSSSAVSGHSHASHRSGFRRASLSWSTSLPTIRGSHDIPRRWLHVASSH